MIPQSLGHLVFGYATGLMAGLILLWLSREFFLGRRRRREHRRCIQCAHCGTLYENSGADPLPACPQCAHSNERLAPPLF